MNPWSTWKDPSLLDVLKMLWESRGSGKGSFSPKLIDNMRPTLGELRAAFPVVSVDRGLIDSPEKGRVQATWIGHSTVLVQLAGCNVLTDPIFEQTCSPIPSISPKRITEPALSISELPRIDAVVISHGHYDHLCERSVIQLHKRFPGLKFFVPLGQKRWFLKRGISLVEELDWWDMVSFQPSSSTGTQECPIGCTNELRIHFAPAQHWSMRRAGWDRNACLWGSWLLETDNNGSFWFAGDTGYSEELFKEIGRRFGSIDLCAIPIGAYEPNWFMKPQHIGPEEAVLVHQHVRSKKSLAIHYATFPLTSEPLDEPPIRLSKALSAAGIPAEEFQCIRHGSTLSASSC